MTAITLNLDLNVCANIVDIEVSSVEKYAKYFVLYANSVMQGEHSNTRFALLSSKMHEFVALHTVTIEFILPDRLANHLDCIKFSE